MCIEKRRWKKMEKKKSFNWKNGDVIELADGERGIYLDGRLYCYNSEGESGFLKVGDYDKDFKHYWIAKFNIIKVWRYSDAYCTDKLVNRMQDKYLKDAKVVFVAPIKMTLSEVCEALGKNIVIVKED